MDQRGNVKPIMNNRKTRLIYMKIIILIFFFMMETGCTHEDSHAAGPDPDKNSSSVKGEVLVTNNLDLDFSQHNATFIELGADSCVPCKAMQPIMKEIAQEYPEKIQVVFYDVWKDPQPARHYRIQLIPTQVFIDQNGEEIHRHVGFFSKDKILAMLKEKDIL